jgi:hypothetical protein
MNIVFLIGACAFGVLCWTWLAYPCLMWIAARAVPSRRSATPTELPSVTAVLASRDDTATVIDRIDDFFRADYPTAQLEVCGSSGFGTPVRDAAFSSRPPIQSAGKQVHSTLPYDMRAVRCWSSAMHSSDSHPTQSDFW